jgi:hypothetical protein
LVAHLLVVLETHHQHHQAKEIMVVLALQQTLIQRQEAVAQAQLEAQTLEAQRLVMAVQVLLTQLQAQQLVNSVVEFTIWLVAEVAMRLLVLQAVLVDLAVVDEDRKPLLRRELLVLQIQAVAVAVLKTWQLLVLEVRAL